jgi:hypothetical protein
MSVVWHGVISCFALTIVLKEFSLHTPQFYMGLIENFIEILIKIKI